MRRGIGDGRQPPRRTPPPTCRPGRRRWSRASESSSSSCSSWRPAPEPGAGRTGRDARRRSACARSRAGRSRSAWRSSRSASSSPPSSRRKARGSATRRRSERRSSRPPPACRPSRTGSRPGSSRSAPRSRPSRSEGEGAADLVKQLNAQARAGADRRRAHRADRERDRPPARGLEAAGPARWQRVGLPGRLARHPGRRRAAVGRRRRSDRGQRRADHADLRDHRHRLVAAGELGLPRAAVPDQRHRTGRPVRSAQRVAGVRRLRPGPERRVRHPGLDRGARRRSTSRPSSGRSRCATRGHSRRLRPGRPRRPAARRAADDAPTPEPDHDRRRGVRARRCSSSSSFARRPATPVSPSCPPRT